MHIRKHCNNAQHTSSRHIFSRCNNSRTGSICGQNACKLGCLGQPKYCSLFLSTDRFADVQFTATPAKYIKYTTGDIEAIVNDDLFEAKVG